MRKFLLFNLTKDYDDEPKAKSIIFYLQICRWVAMLSHFWSRKVDVINRGFSGYNSRWGLSVIEEVVIKYDPQLVIIFFGANDAVVPEGNTFVPLSEFSDNINKMVSIIQQVRL